jgi:hypothetical protein
MRLATIIGAALLAASTGLYAQAPAPGKDGDRAQRREQLKQAHEKAAKACEGKQGAEHRSCMTTQMCAQSKDPKACEARASKARDSHAKARKACEGKDGDARRDCMRKELCAQSKDPAKCEAQAKDWLAKRDAARAACKGKEGDALRSCMRDQMKK